MLRGRVRRRVALAFSPGKARLEAGLVVGEVKAAQQSVSRFRKAGRASRKPLAQCCAKAPMAAPALGPQLEAQEFGIKKKL